MADTETAAPGRDRQVLVLGDSEITLEVRRNRRARRMNLRLAADGDGVVLTLPVSATRSEGLAFVHQHTAWITSRLADQMPRQPFINGATIPYRGTDHAIRHHPEARGGVWREEGEIRVAGRAEHLNRRVRDWLRTEARRELNGLAHAKAGRIERRVTRVTVRDTTSRWGSCTADGRLSFSWRLILAPSYVLDYVVAHEVAHLVELNHGRRFHNLVGQLTDEVKAAEEWLRRRGAELHRYG